MSIDIQSERTAIALQVGGSWTGLDVRKRVINGGGLGRKPVFRAGVAVSKDERREARDRIISMSYTPLGTRLRRDKIGELIVSDAR